MPRPLRKSGPTSSAARRRWRSWPVNLASAKPPFAVGAAGPQPATARHRPHRLTTNLSAMEETLVCELRTALQLPLDDIVEGMRRCINGSLSRNAIHRCLQRHGSSQRKKPARPSVGLLAHASVGVIHFYLKHLPALERLKIYALVAFDRATRYVYVEIHPRR